MTVPNDALDAALASAERRYIARRPRTRQLHERARDVLPGGNTRTVLYHQPFPIRVVHASDAVLDDADGHRYVDLLGNFSAGLYGHSHPAIVDAVTDVLSQGIGPGAHSVHEIAMAEAVCNRFPTIERVRFTNSGTEANLMALSVARTMTGRDRILVFRGAYHGGLLTFPSGPSPVNAPYDVLVAPYNDTAEARRLLERHADSVAAVLVEPMLGAGGCIPGRPDFLRTLRETTTAIGALLVADEVMTSRIGRSGMQERLGIAADLTTLGKYLGGGFSFGAFGGRPEVMDTLDPEHAGSLPHAGTFNNNLASMVAGRAVLRGRRRAVGPGCAGNVAGAVTVAGGHAVGTAVPRRWRQLPGRPSVEVPRGAVAAGRAVHCFDLRHRPGRCHDRAAAGGRLRRGQGGGGGRG